MVLLNTITYIVDFFGDSLEAVVATANGIRRQLQAAYHEAFVLKDETVELLGNVPHRLHLALSASASAHGTTTKNNA